MNYKELAKKLDGVIEYSEVTPEIEKIAKDNNLVIVFSWSDDCVELRGAIYDELSANGGIIFYVNKSGSVFNRCDCGDCPNSRLTKEDKKIEAVWGRPSDKWRWSYKTDIPHETFEVYELDVEDKKWCLGIVFSLDNLEAGDE
jgi:hypothetical protein